MAKPVTRIRAEWYIPMFGGNRAAYEDGTEPLPIRVKIRSRSYGDLREYQRKRDRRPTVLSALQELTRRVAVLQPPEVLAELQTLSGIIGLAVQPDGVDQLDDELDGEFFASHITEIENLVLDDDTVITTGAQAWALRGELPEGLFQELRVAVNDLTTLSRGLIRNLRLPSGSSISQSSGPSPTTAPLAGTVAGVAAQA